jgi:hypothetical protein
MWQTTDAADPISNLHDGSLINAVLGDFAPVSRDLT